MAARKRGRSFVAPDAASAPAEFFPRIQAGVHVGRVVRRRDPDDREFLKGQRALASQSRWLPGLGESISDRPGAD